jgi:hypothetical protein
MYNNQTRRADITRTMIASGQEVSPNTVLEKTMIYFATGFGITSIMTAGMLRNQRILAWSHGMAPMLISISIFFARL